MQRMGRIAGARERGKAEVDVLILGVSPCSKYSRVKPNDRKGVRAASEGP